MDIVDETATLLVVTEKGYGKRTALSEYRKQSRGGKGIIAVRTGDKNGVVVGAMSVRDDDDLMMITAAGMMVRTAVKEISTIGRATQGVRVVRFDEGDRLASVGKIIPDDDEEEGDDGSGKPGPDAGQPPQVEDSPKADN